MLDSYSRNSVISLIYVDTLDGKRSFMAATLIEKLQLKTAMKLALRNAPAGYTDRLAHALKGIEITAQAGGGVQAVPLGTPAVLLFVTTLAEAEKFAPEIVRSVKEDGLVWIANPKGGSGVKTDVNRDRLWPVIGAQGWRPVRMVAIDEVWSAMRVRPEALVKG
jgi:hypothetical protein